MKPPRVVLIAIAISLTPAVIHTQGEETQPLGWDVARAVLIDPTTYVPALVTHEAMGQDWRSSQVLFAHGWLEQNWRYTVSGFANDVPVSYHEGTRRIRGAALTTLQFSVVNNLSVAVVERVLIARSPTRRTLIRTLSWVERIAFASVLTYTNSAAHFRQASANRRLAREYGYTRQ